MDLLRGFLWLGLAAAPACTAPQTSRGAAAAAQPLALEGGDALLRRDGRVEVADARFSLGDEQGVAALEGWLAAWLAAGEVRTLEVETEGGTPMALVVALIEVLERTGVEDFRIVRGVR